MGGVSELVELGSAVGREPARARTPTDRGVRATIGVEGASATRRTPETDHLHGMRKTMDARNESTYGRNLIIRLALLVAISVLSYATPGTVVGQQDNCVTAPPFFGLECGACDHDGDGCWAAACCAENPDGSYWGIDNETGDVKRYKCITWEHCEEEGEGNQ